jgi:hypothetical protein
MLCAAALRQSDDLTGRACVIAQERSCYARFVATNFAAMNRE